MSSARDFLASVLGDALLPALRQPMEDAVYEVLDQRQVPTRTDFRELRNLVDDMRGRVSTATRRAEAAAALEARIDALEARIDALEGLAERVAALEARLAEGPAPATEEAPAAEAPAGEPTEAKAEEPAPEDHATCRVPGCEGRVRARGFCGRHYQQWRRGTLEGFEPPRK